LTPFNFEVLRANDHQTESFRKNIPINFEGTCIYVSWPNMVKIGRRKVVEMLCDFAYKKPAARDSSEPLFCPLRRSRPKFPDLCMFTKSGPDLSEFVRVIPKRLVFRTPK